MPLKQEVSKKSLRGRDISQSVILHSIKFYTMSSLFFSHNGTIKSVSMSCTLRFWRVRYAYCAICRGERSLPHRDMSLPRKYVPLMHEQAQNAFSMFMKVIGGFEVRCAAKVGLHQSQSLAGQAQKPVHHSITGHPLIC